MKVRQTTTIFRILSTNSQNLQLKLTTKNAIVSNIIFAKQPLGITAILSTSERQDGTLK
jgi:hypothetical protein